MKKNMMTSGYNFEGYRIAQYLGVYTGECVLGTGFLSSFSAGLADLTGTNSTLYEDKLMSAKSRAVSELMQQAERAGANAIIGLDIDYTTFSADIMGVVASGTAVYITKDQDSAEERELRIRKTNRNLPFRLKRLTIASTGEKAMLSATAALANGLRLDAILAEVSLRTIFDEEIFCGDVCFFDAKSEDRKQCVLTAPMEKLPISDIRLLKDAQIVVKKYVAAGTALEAPADAEEWIEEEPPLSGENLLDTLEALSSAKEILEYLQENAAAGGEITPRLIDDVSGYARLERIYGNQKKDCLRMLEKELGEG